MTSEEQQTFDLMKEQVRISDEAFNYHLKRANDLLLQVDQLCDQLTQERQKSANQSEISNTHLQKQISRTKELETILQNIIDSCVHPKVAVRCVMVDLKPIRDVLKSYVS